MNSENEQAQRKFQKTKEWNWLKHRQHQGVQFGYFDYGKGIFRRLLIIIVFFLLFWLLRELVLA